MLVVVASVLVLLQISGRLYQPAWLRNMRTQNSNVSHAALIGVAKAFEQAGVLPPDTGFTEHSQPDGNKVIRIQYIGKKPAVVSAGKDDTFKTDDDIICFYKVEIEF